MSNQNTRLSTIGNYWWLSYNFIFMSKFKGVTLFKEWKQQSKINSAFKIDQTIYNIC